jgi:predicted nuclease with RNAse H fold
MVERDSTPFLRPANEVTVVGVDVGGPRKGFHAVALQGGLFLARTESCSAVDICTWCRARDARVIAVDAPCRWRYNGRMRPCESALAAEGMACFATPSRENAENNAFYGWMLNGAALYALLERHFPLFNGVRRHVRVCAETFPQAVACALARKIVRAKKKKTVRAALLRATGLDPALLPNIDYIDAALCALAARHLYLGSFRAYGEAGGGFIVVPR